MCRRHVQRPNCDRRWGVYSFCVPTAIKRTKPHIHKRARRFLSSSSMPTSSTCSGATHTSVASSSRAGTPHAVLRRKAIRPKLTADRRSKLLDYRIVHEGPDNLRMHEERHTQLHLPAVLILHRDRLNHKRDWLALDLGEHSTTPRNLVPNRLSIHISGTVIPSTGNANTLRRHDLPRGHTPHGPTPHLLSLLATEAAA